MRRNRKPLTCTFCKETFYRAPSKIKNSKSGLHFCNRSCKDEAQKIKHGLNALHPDHYNTGNGKTVYRRIALTSLPHRCNRCGYSRFVEVLAVHHIDRDHHNHDIKNLELLCHNCHAEEHLLNG